MELSEALLREAAKANMPDPTGPACDTVAAFDDLVHALVNALNTIVAASELARLMIARNEPEAATRPLASIEPECMRAARLLRDARAFMAYRIRPVQDGIDLVALLTACAIPFAERVHVDTRVTVPAIRGDADALSRMFAEILNNAFQFGAHAVRVGMAAKASGNEIMIDIDDDGPGIDANVMRIFEPFFGTSAGERSGLGLSLAAMIATAHGGSVGVNPAKRGASFRVSLPAQVA